MADRMAVMHRGRIEQVGSPEEVYRTPRTAMVAGFIGETNLVKGRVVEVRGDFVMADTPGGPLVGRLACPETVPAAGQEVVLSVRPEAWRLDAGGENGLAGKILSRTYLGQRIQYVVGTALGPQQVVELNPPRVREPGEEVVRLSARHADVIVLES